MALPMLRRPVSLMDELERMQREMDEIFEILPRTKDPLMLQSKFMSSMFKPPLMDLEEKDNLYIIKAEMPGLDKNDIKIEAEQNMLTITGERKEAKEEKQKDSFYSERSYNGYRRTIQLPSGINPEKIDAEYKNGLLTLTMEKMFSSKKKEITPR
ncbi:MAG: Hsp20/alpha crystallin family protein [Candidatus Micrarchaeota archaeon]